MHATTIYENGVEFFVNPDGELYFHEKGKSKPFTQITIDLATLIRKELDADRRALQSLEDWGITDPFEQLRQYTRCRWGGKNIRPDLVGGRLADEQEYWECGHRGACPYEGRLCHSLTSGGNIISHSEMMVARLVIKGYRNKEIAQATGKSVETIKMQVKSMLQKIGGRSRVDIVNFLHSKI